MIITQVDENDWVISVYLLKYSVHKVCNASFQNSVFSYIPKSIAVTTSCSHVNYKIVSLFAVFGS